MPNHTMCYGWIRGLDIFIAQKHKITRFVCMVIMWNGESQVIYYHDMKTIEVATSHCTAYNSKK